MDNPNLPAAPMSGLAGFLEPHEISGGCGVDLALVMRAVKGRWPMKPEVRTQIMQRLGEIVARESVIIPGESGGLNEAIADRNAISAANVLRLMEEEDRAAQFKAAAFIQADRHHRTGSLGVNVNVNVKLWGKDAPVDEV